MTTQIDVINSMLATTGTLPLSAKDSKHPSFIEASRTLETILEEFCSKQLWFNTHKRTFQPDSEGRIVVPGDALWASSTDDRDLSIRGQYLFDNDKYTFNIGEAVEVIVVRNTPLEEMPPTAVQFVRAAARLEYFIDQDGDQFKTTRYEGTFTRKELALTVMNNKLMKQNFFSGPSAQNFYTRRSAGNGRLPVR